MKKKIMVVTGELSGDVHAAGLLGRLKIMHPDIEISGTGGDALKRIGATLLFTIDRMATIGLGEVAKKYRMLKHIMNTLIQVLDEDPPDLVIVVDYGGFNLRFIPHVKKRGIPVIYYISPQVWASREKRVHAIKKYTDALISIMPFEVEFYRRFGMDIHYFGHPLADIVKKTRTRKETAEKHRLDPSKNWIVFLLGSRQKEVQNHAPVMETAAAIICAQRPDTECISCVPSNFDQFELHIDPSKSNIRFIKGDTYNIIGHGQFAAACSGTVSLETALLGTPMLVFYKPDYLSYLIGRYVFGVKTIGLPNVIMGKPFVKELIEHRLPDNGKKPLAEHIALSALERLAHPERADAYKRDADVLKRRLYGNGAYEKAARFIGEFLNKKAPEKSH